MAWVAGLGLTVGNTLAETRLAQFVAMSSAAARRRPRRLSAQAIFDLPQWRRTQLQGQEGVSDTCVDTRKGLR